MNNKHILATCVTLLYLRSCLTQKSDSGSSLVTQVLEFVKLPELTTGTLDQERDTLSALTKTIKAMLHDESTIDPISLVQRITLDCGHDEILLSSMRGIIEAKLEDDDLRRAVINYEKELTKFIRRSESTDILYEAARALKFDAENIEDPMSYLIELMGKLEPYTSKTGYEDPAVINEFDLSDAEAVDQVFEEAKKNEDGVGSFVFGFKHVNKFFNGSLPPGKFVLVGALQHQHKTGFTLALFRHAAMYNTPHLREDEQDRKPLLVRVSSEDEAADNLRKLFTDTYFNVEKKVPNFNDCSSEYMRAYINEKLSATGWHIKFMRINPSLWTYRDIERKVIEFESQGYAVKMFMLDYLMMIPTTGCEVGPAGNDKRDLVRRIRNFMSSRGIVFITPWQLSPAATQMLRDGRDNLVKEFRDKSMYSGSTQINQEVDLEILIHIETINGVKYLTIARGKYRQGGIVVPDKDLYCALPFHPEAGLQDDLYGPTLGVSVPGAVINADGEEESPMWDFG